MSNDATNDADALGFPMTFAQVCALKLLGSPSGRRHASTRKLAATSNDATNDADALGFPMTFAQVCALPQTYAHVCGRKRKRTSAEVCAPLFRRRGCLIAAINVHADVPLFIRRGRLIAAMNVRADVGGRQQTYAEVCAPLPIRRGRPIAAINVDQLGMEEDPGATQRHWGDPMRDSPFNPALGVEERYLGDGDTSDSDSDSDSGSLDSLGSLGSLNPSPNWTTMFSPGV